MKPSIIFKVCLFALFIPAVLNGNLIGLRSFRSPQLIESVPMVIYVVICLAILAVAVLAGIVVVLIKLISWIGTKLKKADEEYDKMKPG